MTTFDSLRVKVGRRPITVVEVDLDSCANTYGTLPCTAAVGTTGTAKCYNTFKTCQDTAHFSKITNTLKFCTETSFLPVGQTIFPCITNVDIAPTQLDPSGFSVSASVSVTLKDFPHHDRGMDPYNRENTAGSFFGRLRARNPYLINRQMRVNTGYVDKDRTIYTSTRVYFIDHMEGPDSNGNVKIVGKDVLRFADQEKSQAPVASKGTLSADITSSATNLTLVPSGISSTYPTSGTIRIGDELITYTTITGDTLFGLTRGTDGTTAATHKAGDSVQTCIRYSSATVPFVLKDLLTNYAGINSSYIPYSDWTTEASTWIGSFLCSTVISKPTGVNDLLKEIIQATGCALWWDEESASIRFKVIVPVVPSGTVPVLTDSQNILAGSMKVKDLESDRLSRVIVYLNLISQVGDIKATNFRTASITADAVSESANAYGVPSTLEIPNRWVPSVAVAGDLGTRLLARYKETPREIVFRVDAKDASLKTGDLVDIQSRLIQAVDGSANIVRFIITEKQEVDVGTTYEYTALQVSTTGGGVATLITPDAEAVWTSASSADRAKYLFISNDAGVMSDLSPGPKIT